MLVYYIRNKTFPKTLSEQTNDLLSKEIDRLEERMQALQKENDEMTRAVIQQLR